MLVHAFNATEKTGFESQRRPKELIVIVG